MEKSSFVRLLLERLFWRLTALRHVQLAADFLVKQKRIECGSRSGVRMTSVAEARINLMAFPIGTEWSSCEEVLVASGDLRPRHRDRQYENLGSSMGLADTGARAFTCTTHDSVDDK